MGEKLVLKESRKTFIPVYGLVGVLSVGVSYLYLTGTTIGLKTGALIGATAMLGLAIPEIARAFEFCTVSKDKISITSGLFRKRHKIYFTNTLSDIHLRSKFNATITQLWND